MVVRVVVDRRVVVVVEVVVVRFGPLRMRTTGRLLLLGSGEACGLRFMSLVRIILKRFRMLASSFKVSVDCVGEELAVSVLMFTTGWWNTMLIVDPTAEGAGVGGDAKTEGAGDLSASTGLMAGLLRPDAEIKRL